MRPPPVIHIFLTVSCFLGDLTPLFSQAAASIFSLQAGEEAESPVSAVEPSLRDLLDGFLKKDPRLKELEIEAARSGLNYRRAGVENGFSIDLSTGSSQLYFEDSDSVFSASPRAVITIPQLKDARIDFTAPFKAGGAASQDGGFAVEDVQLSLSAQILGDYSKTRKVTLLKAQRAFWEASRNLKKRAAAAEKEFYEAVYSLYEMENEALSAEETAYTKEIDLSLIRSMGYAPSSVRFRTAALEASSAHRSAGEQRRRFERELSVFARDCGFQSLSSLPSGVEPVNLEELEPFGSDEQKRRFSGVEKAEWARYIGGLSRSASQNWELRGEGGFTANNTRSQGGFTADAGLTLNWRGVSLSASASAPVSAGGGKPVFSFAVGLNSNSQRLSSLNDEEKRLEREAEEVALADAEREWEDAVEAVRIKRLDLQWERGRLAAQYELYRELLFDAETSFNEGLLSESDYRKAAVSEKRSRGELALSDIKSRLHVLESALYFVED
ncbi:MAG: hypothetical protein LBC53_03595 [Spirochaetaceae bacterium]|nr:hypothetical protein [Spirochaetaceae bacterium]